MNVYMITFGTYDYDFCFNNHVYKYINYSSLTQVDDDAIDFYGENYYHNIRINLERDGVITYQEFDSNKYVTFIDINYNSYDGSLDSVYCSIIRIISADIRSNKLNSLLDD